MVEDEGVPTIKKIIIKSSNDAVLCLPVIKAIPVVRVYNTNFPLHFLLLPVREGPEGSQGSKMPAEPRQKKPVERSLTCLNMAPDSSLTLV